MLKENYCGVQNYSVSGFIIFELFTVIFFQDWAGWGIFTVIPGNPRRTKGDSQHLEARPELQDWPLSELFTVKNSRTGPFSNYLGNNFELYSNRSRSGSLSESLTRWSPTVTAVVVVDSNDSLGEADVASVLWARNSTRRPDMYTVSESVIPSTELR